MMINLVECKMVANEANCHQGASLLDHPPNDVSKSVRDELLKRKSNDENPFLQREVINQETYKIYGIMSLSLDEGGD
jgi:hypothetical protein